MVKSVRKTTRVQTGIYVVRSTVGVAATILIVEQDAKVVLASATYLYRPRRLHSPSMAGVASILFILNFLHPQHAIQQVTAVVLSDTVV